MARRLTRPHPDSRERALVAARAASAKKGEDVAVLDVCEIISIIDCFVLVSAGNTRLVRTIVDEVEAVLKAHDGSTPIGVEGLDDSTWVLLDYGDIVVHVFLEETRAFYDLDRLWGDAPRPGARRTLGRVEVGPHRHAALGQSRLQLSDAEVPLQARRVEDRADDRGLRAPRRIPPRCGRGCPRRPTR